METLFILAIVELVLKYGVPTAIDLVNTWSTGLDHEPTKEDFEALRLMVLAPETFFE